MTNSVRDFAATDVGRVSPNTHHRYGVSIAGDKETSDTTIPVHLIAGKANRPCLGLIAGVHGDEYEGIRALQEITREYQPRDLIGSLLIVPVANPYAFASGQRRTPADAKDLNRVFPGSPEGTVSERLAHGLCGLLQKTDLAFSLHGSGVQGILSPWVEYLNSPDTVGQATHAAAKASGFPDIIALPAMPGLLQTAMAALGIPLIEGEVGGRGATRRENVDYYKQRVLAVGRHVGVIPQVEASQERTIEVRTWTLLRLEVDAQGIFLRKVELGQNVHAGDILGEVLDMQGDIVSTIRAPQPGVIGGYRIHAGVRPKDRVFTLWCRMDFQ